MAPPPVMTFRPATKEADSIAGYPAAMRRGACPSIAAPMVTGDGLLVRLRPVRPGLTLPELVAIADAANRTGNGLVEITARGNLQLRGLTTETVPILADAISGAGIELAEGLAIETPPLVGLDPAAVTDPLPLADALRAAVRSHVPPLMLAPKLSVVIDAGERFHLGALTADIRLRAVSGEGRVAWMLSLGGNEATARAVAVLDEPSVLPAVLLILDHLSSLGPHARARDIDPAFLAGRIAPMGFSAHAALPSPVVSRVGIHDLGAGCVVLGVGLAFGQVAAGNLKAFLEAMMSLGASELRLSPGQSMLFHDLPSDMVVAAQALALGHGLRAFPDDPRNTIAACAGLGACASSGIDTRMVAGLLVEEAAALLDGSLTVHVSGCAKGCARPSASALTIVPAEGGYGLVLDGSAKAEPVMIIGKKDMRTVLQRLGRRVQEGKRAGESARSCLTRLGADVLAAAVRQG